MSPWQSQLAVPEAGACVELADAHAGRLSGEVSRLIAEDVSWGGVCVESVVWQAERQNVNHWTE